MGWSRLAPLCHFPLFVRSPRRSGLEELHPRIRNKSPRRTLGVPGGIFASREIITHAAGISVAIMEGMPTGNSRQEPCGPVKFWRQPSWLACPTIPRPRNFHSFSSRHFFQSEGGGGSSLAQTPTPFLLLASLRSLGRFLGAVCGAKFPDAAAKKRAPLASPEKYLLAPGPRSPSN